MNITETPFGILFSEYHFPNWMEYISILILLLFVPLCYLIKNTYGLYRGIKKVLYFFTILIVSFLLVNAAGLFYRINQSSINYNLELRYKNGTNSIVITSGNSNVIYKSGLYDYKGFCYEFKRSSLKSTNNNKLGDYNLYLLRKDGVLIYLNSYSNSIWSSVLLKLKSTNLPVLDIPFYQLKTDSLPKLNHDFSKLVSGLKTGALVNAKNNLNYSFDLKANKIVLKIMLPIILIVWLLIFLTGGGSSIVVNIFKYGFIMIFTLAFGFYFLNTNLAKQYLSFTDKEYRSYIKSKCLGITQETNGDWKDVKSMSIILGLNKNASITIYEEEYDMKNPVTFLSSGLKSEVNNKIKSIYLEGLPIDEQIMIADFIIKGSYSRE
jgi:hypothetical protein